MNAVVHKLININLQLMVDHVTNQSACIKYIMSGQRRVPISEISTVVINN